jgi:hypothetical protein
VITSATDLTPSINAFISQAEDESNLVVQDSSEEETEEDYAIGLARQIGHFE